jgi:hypothetical protein
MRKENFVYIGLHGHTNIIYENVTNHERLEQLMKMFSNDPLAVKIPYGYYDFLPSIIYVTCELDPNQFCLHYKRYNEKDGYNDLLVKIDCIVECKHDHNTNQFTVVYQK